MVVGVSRTGRILLLHILTVNVSFSLLFIVNNKSWANANLSTSENYLKKIEFPFLTTNDLQKLLG